MNVANWNSLSLLTPEFISNIKFTYVFGNGVETLIVTKDDDVFSVGHNCFDGLSEWGPDPEKVEQLCKKKVKSFQNGVNHVIALTETGAIYVWGENRSGELGFNNSRVLKVPVLLIRFTPQTIVQICCGSNHTLALDETGKVWGWGLNSSNQIDVNIRSNILQPKQIAIGKNCKPIKSVACSSVASFAVTRKGKIFGWGNLCGIQLNMENITQRIKTPNNDDFITAKVVCGINHILVLSDKGKIKVIGSHRSQKMELSTINESILWNTRHKFEDIGRVMDIAASPFCNISAAKTIDGSVYAWGAIGGNDCVIDRPSRTPFKLLSDVFAVCVQPSVTYETLPVFIEETNCAHDKFGKVFNDSKFADIKINVNDTTLYVQKDILKIQSQYFKAMFQEHWNNTSVINIDQFSYEAYKAYLYFLYTGILDVDGDIALELLKLADCHCEDGLKKKCVDLLKTKITVDNALLQYVAGINSNASELATHAFNFSISNFTSVVQSKAFDLVDLETMKTFIQSAATAGAFQS